MIYFKQYFLVLAAMLSAQTTLATEQLCKPCPDGTTPVSIAFWNADVYDSTVFQSSFAPDYFYSRPSGIKDLGSHRVTSPDEMRRKLIEVGNSCQRVKFLFIASHGANGVLAFNSGDLDAYNVGTIFNGLDCAMAKGAAIEFGGCNVGRGCRGDDFMVETARLLLPKGGFVKAPTSYSTGLPGTPRFSLNLEHQIIMVGAGYASPLFLVTPSTGETCRDYLWSEYQKIVNLKHDLDVCAYSKARSIRIDKYLAEIREAGLAELARGEHRQSFDSDHAKKAQAYLRAYESAVIYREDLSNERKILSGCDFSKFPGYGPAPVAGTFKPSTVATSPPPTYSPKKKIAAQ